MASKRKKKKHSIEDVSILEEEYDEAELLYILLVRIAKYKLIFDFIKRTAHSLVGQG